MKMDDGTVIRSKQLEITISFFTDNAKLVNALFTEMHK